MDLALFFSETQWRQIFLTWSYPLTWWKYPIPRYICITAVLEHGFLQRKSFRCCHLLDLYVRGLSSTTSHASQKQLQCSRLSPQHIRLSCPRQQGNGSTSTQNQIEAINPKKTGHIHNHQWDVIHRQTDQVSSNRLKKDNIFLSVAHTQKTSNKKHQWQNRIMET